MQRRDIIELLRTHQETLRHYGVKSLSLFGSVARDEAGADSDIDLLVEFDGAATFDQYADLQLFLEELLACEVDLLTQNGLRPRLRPHVEAEAIRVA